MGVLRTMSSNGLIKLRERIAPLRAEIIQHPAFQSMKSLEDLQRFMEMHAYAVWDFMSLLKSLQRKLTCIEVPWQPVGEASIRFLINEIVTGEESDIDPEGDYISHFELYMRAMKRAGADTGLIERFLHRTSEQGLDAAIAHDETPESAKQFLNTTFRFIDAGKPHVLAAVFTFGREDLIPDMFLSFVDHLKSQFPNEVGTLRYYLERHIEVDGDHHSHLAYQMTEKLCGNDPIKWQEANEAVMEALEARRLLWEGLLTAEVK